MTEFDKMWNYTDAIGTESKFREALKNLSFEQAPSQYLQLLTQIARAQSLQYKFEDAHRTLDEVNAKLSKATSVELIRYCLERGRIFNSSGDKQNANLFFTQSLDTAKKLGEDFYAIDAIHMLAITAPPDLAICLNEEAVLIAEKSVQPLSKNWLGSLYNNLGWSYFDKADYEKAFSIFLRALKWREEMKQEQEIFLAKWCVARTLRALKKYDEAVTIQLGLFEEIANKNQKDGYVYEELGELYLAKNDPIHRMYFQFAYTELSQDPWLAKNEPARIERLKQLCS